MTRLKMNWNKLDRALYVTDIFSEKKIQYFPNDKQNNAHTDSLTSFYVYVP
jgi:hypothetical protein